MARGYKAEHPCSLCGQPTRSKLSVCYRPGGCRNENRRLTKAAMRGKVPRQRHPCSLCGGPTTSKLPVCGRRGKCQAEYNRLTYRASEGAAAREAIRPLASHPCSICGLPTASKFGMCSRPGRCKTEYARLRVRELRDSDLRASEWLTRTRPCSLCGLPTTSKYGVCPRPGNCKVQYMRLRTREAQENRPAVPCPACGGERERDDSSAYCAACKATGAAKEHRRERRNETVRERRRAQKGASSVYAVWFPVPRVLKVGFTAHTQDSLFVGAARTRAVRRGWNADGGSCIWKRSGDLRTESWMQVTLAFRWLPAFDQKQSRICEWFTVPGFVAGEIAGVLDEVYETVPADMTANVPAMQLQMF